MRIAVCVILVFLGTAAAQSKTARFGIDIDADRFPQKTAQDALRSVLKAMEARQIDYLLAQLAEPTFVDQRVKEVGGKFETMVKETTKKLEADPEAMRELRRFLTDGEWKEDGNSASAGSKDVRGKKVFFKKIGDRWFFENRIRADK